MNDYTRIFKTTPELMDWYFACCAAMEYEDWLRAEQRI